MMRPDAWNLPLIVLGLAASTVARAIPPPPERLAVICEEPVFASDRVVCGDPELLALDRRMSALLGQIDLAAAAAADPGFETQVDWFRRRSLCAFSAAHQACLRALYVERIATLEALRAD